MLQSPEVVTLPAELRETLSALLGDVSLSEEAVHDGSLPLVLMLRSHAVAAFAFGDESDYQPLYEAFKKFYLKRSAEWSTKDVSFVYCLPEGVSAHESFCSRVEVDVYFCRKYVIHLEQDLRSSLARLPFLPLSPVSGMPTRPPSAQTMLAQRSMKAVLASALVMPGRSSAESILDASLAGKYGAPHKVDATIGQAQAESVAEERGQSTLKSISIQNFRAYRSKKDFVLGSALTILYGPNGFGKTSFFDAVDFAVTGSVRRLSRASEGFDKAAKHLDSAEEPTFVSITVERDGKPHVITRDLADPNNAQIDGKATSRKDVLSLLTGGGTTATDRLEHMVSLFRATHLFNQDGQELTQDVASKCELPADIVSRMLAFEDYVGGSRKTNDVLKLARQRVTLAKRSAADARQVVESESKELARLEELASAKASPELLNARFKQLEVDIGVSGIDLPDIDVRDTRGLRALLEAAAAEAVTTKASATNALVHVGNWKTLQAQSEAHRVHLEERVRLASEAETAANASAATLGALTSDLAQKKTLEQSSQNARDLLVWAVSTQPEHARLTAQIQTLTGDLAHLTSLCDKQAQTQAAASNVQQAAAAEVKRHEEVLRVAGESRLRAHSVNEQAAQWAPAASRLLALITQEGELQRSIEARRLQLSEAQQALLTQEQLVARIERELTSARANDSSLKKLISELRSHVDGANCLLCGHDHGSKAALLEAIDKRMEHGDLVVRIGESLALEKGKLQTQVTQRQALLDQAKQEEQKLALAKAERENLEHQWSALESALMALGVSTTGDILAPLAQLKAQAFAAEMAAAFAVNEARLALSAADQALTDIQLVYQSLERERLAAIAALENAKRQVSELVNKARRAAINLEAGLEALGQLRQEADVTLGQATAAVQASNGAVESQKSISSAAKASLAAARALQQQAATAWTAHETAMQQQVSALNALKFGSDVTDEELRGLIQRAVTREANAIGLRDRVAELEVAVDTAATSAAFENLRSRIDANHRIAQESDGLAAKLEPWVKYFDDVAKVLDSQQAVLTEHFINEYGPRTAVIQQRLRPVYGFGDIEVSSNGSAIGIRVLRGGVELRPTDYFSQSQVQTLVLGLFLTACSSQTWSGFSSVMMDDPVTHFDDLNTYALLDLISGLQSSPEGAKQFVISTCDERLLQLARQKFRHLGPAAKFYRFSAIGTDGPMVSEIPA